MCGAGHQSHLSHLFLGERAQNPMLSYLCAVPVTKVTFVTSFLGGGPLVTFTYALAVLVLFLFELITRCRAIYVQPRSPKSP